MRATCSVTGWSIHPSSTRGTNSGQAFSWASNPCCRSASRYAWLLTVASVAITMAERLRLTSAAMAAPGSTTPTTWTVGRLFDLRQGQRSRGVARDDQQIDVLGFEKAGSADGVARHRVGGLGSVGQSGSVSKIQIVRRQLLGHGPQHGQAADARVEHSDAWKSHGVSFKTCPMPLAR